MKNVVVVSPHGRNGGSIVLHLLCKGLSNRGYNCKIFYAERIMQPNESLACFWAKSLVRKIKRKIKIKKNTPDSVPVTGCRRKYFPFVGKNTIVVYPELFAGNILNAKHVVRWLLYFPRDKVKCTYSGDDLVIAFREVFNDYELNPDCKMVRLSSFDTNLFRQTNFGVREGCCYILRKGKSRNDIPAKFDGPVIDNWPFKKQVEALNKYKYCYIYDTQTAYGTISALCGCIPIVMLEEGKTRNDYKKGDDSICGIAYGNTPDEINRAVETRGDLLQNVKKREQENEKNITYFIDECNKFFFDN